MEKETKTKYFLFFDKTESLSKVLEKRERRKSNRPRVKIWSRKMRKMKYQLEMHEKQRQW